ncbi:hypothetical protein ID866_5187 [Astraeus odoratus]|nr:hypothetical protein ID866_5187 [Astraeus odoratus]
MLYLRGPSALAVLVATLVLSAQTNAFGAAFSFRKGSRQATVCNGSSDLCGRSYGNVTFVGTHDSYAVGINNLATNQDYNISQQLKDGIRMLQVQTHDQNGTIQLCHTSCVLLSILIVNSDGFLPVAYDAIYKAVGLDAMSYVPPSASVPASQWPSLGSLIDSGKRLITFMDAGADFTSVPYIIDEFTNIWETPYDVTSTFDCSINRTQGDTSTQMYLINHFLDVELLGQPVPDPSQANQTNAVSGPNSLGVQVELCASEYGRNPNFMLVDFYEYGGGSIFEVTAAANGVVYSPATPIATPIPQNGSSAPGASNSTSAPNSALSPKFGAGALGMAISGILFSVLHGLV